ncbi:hypothetical protein [Sphaerisporangium aureirubrum]|uniref:Uncharacterized protein n=1 Tax=Sphaerisporangium aureirubrum TaxID=1544736 RepID=A0ABW1NHT0_9ACTN
MNRPGDMPADRADWAARLLALAVLLLPARRREWGQAMRAELVQIEPAPARRRFALSCLRVSLAQPQLLAAAAYHLVTLGAIGAVIAWTDGLTYAPLRAGLIALVTALAALSWLARRPGLLGPVHPGRAARLFRAGGFVLVGAVTLLVVQSLRVASAGLAEKAEVGVPILGTVLVVHTMAFAAVTARRSPASSRALVVGGACGVAAALECLVPIVLRPPVPVSNGWALLTIATSAVAALLIGVNRAGSAGQGLIAALCAAVVTTLLIFAAVSFLFEFAPHWIPDTSPANVAPADRLANNRAGAEDPYFALLALGCLLAAALAVVTTATRRPLPAGRTM